LWLILPISSSRTWYWFQSDRTFKNKFLMILYFWGCHDMDTSTPNMNTLKKLILWKLFKIKKKKSFKVWKWPSWTTRDGQKLSKVNWVEVANENDTGVVDRRVETAAHWLHPPIRMRSLNLLNRVRSLLLFHSTLTMNFTVTRGGG
jgi:hypothetical protein